MAGSFVLALLCLTLANGLPDCPTMDGVRFVDQPQDSTVCAGSQVRMDCTYTGIETTPLWLINSTIYPTSALPPHHRYNGRALILNSAFIEENDTTYQCSFDLFDSRSGSICQLRSTVGKLIVVASDVCQQRPENIIRTVGEFDVFIPCTVTGYNPQIWEINGSIYELFQLPEIFTPIYGGISIKVIQKDLNGMSFRCYTSTGDGYTVEASLTTYLTVISRGGSVNFDDDNSDLYIDHQSTFFDGNITLSWKPVSDPRCNDYEVISQTRCEQTSPIESMWHLRQLSVDIPAKYLSINGIGDYQERANIFIKAINQNGFVCNETEATMQVEDSVTTKKLNSSFSRTQPFKFSTMKNSTFNLVLPRSGIWEDCFCPVFFYRHADCYNLKTCSCLGNTVFSNSFIEFCHLEDGDISIQIQNLTNEMNGNRLSIFHEFFCRYNLKLIPPYRIYTNSFEIAIVLPEPPNVTTDIESDELCILPYNANEIQPDSYRILVYDITGETILLQDNIMAKINSSTCISLYNITEQCAPLLVSVSAVNIFGQVDTTTSISSENTTSDVCLCLNETVRLSVKSVAAVESSSITLDVLCYQSKYTSNFKTETAIDCDREMKQEILCNDVNSEKIIFDGLSCGTSYNISIYWRSPDQSSGVHCLLFQKVEQTLQCWLLVVYIVPATLIIIIIIIIIITTSAVIFRGRCRKRKIKLVNYQDNSGSTGYEQAVDYTFRDVSILKDNIIN